MARKSRHVGRNEDDQRPDFSMSDEELGRLMGLHSPPGPSQKRASEPDVERLRPGTRVSGTVLDNRGEEILLELGPKTHGVVPAAEFEPDPPPEVGSTLEATFVRFDHSQDLAVLSVTEVRREVFWDSISVGTVLEGVVAGSNKGGLVVRVKNVEAFMPLSQIDTSPVQDPETYVGKRLRFQVADLDRHAERLVVSRRALLEREKAEAKRKLLSELIEGEVVTGTVVRVMDFGVFIDLGGVEGLLHKQKILRELGRDFSLAAGQKIQVEIARVDAARGRVALDIRRELVTGPSRATRKGGLREGQTLVGWIRRIAPEGAYVAFEEEQEEGLIPAELLCENYKEGSVVQVRVLTRDPETDTPIVEPRRAGPSEPPEL